METKEKNFYDGVKELIWDKKYKDAYAALETKGSPIDIEFWTTQAILFHEAGMTDFENNNLEKALENFTNLAKIFPLWGVVYNNIGCVYIRTAEYDKAKANISQAIALSDDTYADAYYNLGFVEFKQGNTQKAQEYFNKASELDPNKEYTPYI